MGWNIIVSGSLNKPDGFGTGEIIVENSHSGRGADIISHSCALNFCAAGDPASMVHGIVVIQSGHIRYPAGAVTLH